MQLFQRVKFLAKEVAGSETRLAEKLGLPQRKLNGYLCEKSQKNLWEYLPAILETYPHISRDWLYFGEGDMLREENPRPKIFNDLAYYDDALGRIFTLTGIRTTDAFELQTLFGADFKEAKRFISRYTAARIARNKWKEEGSKEELEPPAPEPIPDEWLQYFWTHFGPNPLWIQHGEREYGNMPLLRECPRSAPLERLNAALLEAQQECKELRARLAAVEQGEAAGGTKKATKPQTAPIPTSALGERPETDRG